MKLGCLGCLGTLLGSMALLALAGGGLWAWSRAWEAPSPLPTSLARPASPGLDRKLADLHPPNGERATRREPIVLNEAEVSAVTSRYLEDAGLLTSPLSTEMRPGRAVVQWRGPVGALLKGPPFGWLSSVLTQSMKEAPLWITLYGAVEVQVPTSPRRPRYAEVTLTSARVGRLRVPGWLLALMAGPRGSSLLRWPVPAAVDQIEMGEGRLTIRTR